MPRQRTYGLDFDTIAYANRIKSGAGTVLSNEALKQINKFVIGIKRMKLWDKMVCWPMRSIHNAGTGSTVYSLGKSDRDYNGVLTNSPTWERDGIRSTGLGAPPPFIQLTNTKKTNYITRSIAYCFSFSGYTVDDAHVMTGNYNFTFASPSGQGFNLGISRSKQQWGYSQNYKEVVQAPSAVLQQRNFVFTTFDQGNITSSWNTTNKQTNSLAPYPLTDTNSIRCMAMQGGSLGGRGLNGVMSIVFDFDNALNDSQVGQIYTLYKQTIGRNLNLI
jgi:hypothetical protein